LIPGKIPGRFPIAEWGCGVYFVLPMTTLVGLFFSLISVLGLLKGPSKKVIRKIVLILFSLLLILAQVLFMNSKLTIDSQDFIAISGVIGGIILILSFQKGEAW
jgi:hypothetical protein